MSNPRDSHRNHECNITTQIEEQSSTQKNRRSDLKGKIGFVISIAPIVIDAFGLIISLVSIDDKPSISFTCIIRFVAFLSISGIIFFFYWYRPIPPKGKTVLGVLAMCMVFLQIIIFQSWQISKENTLKEVENDEQQMLAQAELYYNGEQYKSAVELYTSEPLLENAIAQNNLGYMYSKGIYFKQDFDTAIHYYELAANQGSSDAVHNLISLQLYSCATFEEVVNVLYEGYNSGDRGTFLFIGSIVQGKELSDEPMTVQMRSSIVRDIESFFTANAETHANTLSASFGPPQSGPVFSSDVPQESGSIYEQYILNGSGSIDPTYVYNYIKSPRTFLYDNLMQEHFASVTDSN